MVVLVALDWFAALERAKFGRAELSARAVSLASYPMFPAIYKAVVVDMGDFAFALVPHIAFERLIGSVSH